MSAAKELGVAELVKLENVSGFGPSRLEIDWSECPDVRAAPPSGVRLKVPAPRSIRVFTVANDFDAPSAARRASDTARPDLVAEVTRRSPLPFWGLVLAGAVAVAAAAGAAAAVVMHAPVPAGAVAR